jgi:hypothetical protein
MEQAWRAGQQGQASPKKDERPSKSQEGCATA